MAAFLDGPRVQSTRDIMSKTVPEFYCVTFGDPQLARFWFFGLRLGKTDVDGRFFASVNCRELKMSNNAMRLSQQQAHHFTHAANSATG